MGKVRWPPSPGGKERQREAPCKERAQRMHGWLSQPGSYHAPFILSFFNRYLFGSYYVPGTALDAKNTTVNKTNHIPALTELTPLFTSPIFHPCILISSSFISSHSQQPIFKSFHSNIFTSCVIFTLTILDLGILTDFDLSRSLGNSEAPIPSLSSSDHKWLVGLGNRESAMIGICFRL